MSEPKKKRGRPTRIYPDSTRDEIIELVGEGKSLVMICKREDMPTRKRVHEWIQKDENFRDRYARAKELCAEYHADLMLELSQSMVGKALKGSLPNAGVYAVRAHLDTIKWAAAHLAPKKYGKNNVISLETSESKPAFSIHFDDSKNPDIPDDA